TSGSGLLSLLLSSSAPALGVVPRRLPEVLGTLTSGAGGPSPAYMCADPPGLRTIRPAEVVLSAVEETLTVACHDVRMNKATWAMLNDSEQELLRSAEPASLARLDEDALVDLHARVRRARRKYTMLYRRRASSQVEKDRDRAKAHAQHART